MTARGTSPAVTAPVGRVTGVELWNDFRDSQDYRTCVHRVLDSARIVISEDACL